MIAKLKEIYNYREMIRSLVKKELRGRYKGSILGFFWTFLNPFLQLIVYTMVFSVILRSDIDKYYLFLFVGLIPWIFFASSITAGSSSILANQNMVKKIYFPREVIPISVVTTNFFNMLYTFVVVFAVVIFSGVQIEPFSLLYLPIIMIVEYILALGITFLVSAFTVYFRDLEYILGILVMAWQFLTPIMYEIKIVPDSVRPIFNLNPMTPVIMAYRDILYYGKTPLLFTLLHALVLGILFLLLGTIIFNKLQKGFAEQL